MPPSDRPFILHCNLCFSANKLLDCKHNKPRWRTSAQHQHVSTDFGSSLWKTKERLKTLHVCGRKTFRKSSPHYSQRYVWPKCDAWSVFHTFNIDMVQKNGSSWLYTHEGGCAAMSFGSSWSLCFGHWLEDVHAANSCCTCMCAHTHTQPSQRSLHTACHC